jgi:enamine deaminase RidA (YjgF/YER057c/UK114 family)
VYTFNQSNALTYGDQKMDADKLVKAYIKIRDAKDKLVREHEEQLKGLTDQMEVIEQELLELCKETGQDGGKTQFGTFTRTVKTRYWTSDWDSMYRFIREHNAPELLERRIAQGNIKEFLETNPDVRPEGLNTDSRYSITVRRASK